MSNIIIRPISETDNIILATVIRTVFLEYDAPKEGTVYSDPTTDNLFELFRTTNSVLYVAEVDNEILGCCGIFPTEGLPQGCTEIVKFYLSNKGRGKGFGKLLYKACEEKAIALNYNQLYIESIPKFNTAVGLYQKLGFKALNAPLGNSGHFGCNIWLHKQL
ncbi:MAG: GNAT family N-acetyltransferase [Crocinitomicaceae bacterium]